MGKRPFDLVNDTNEQIKNVSLSFPPKTSLLYGEEGGGGNRIIRGMMTFIVFVLRGRGFGIASLFEQGVELVMDLVRGGVEEMVLLPPTFV
jgi:hypothetical protein